MWPRRQSPHWQSCVNPILCCTLLIYSRATSGWKMATDSFIGDCCKCDSIAVTNIFCEVCNASAHRLQRKPLMFGWRFVLKKKEECDQASSSPPLFGIEGGRKEAQRKNSAEIFQKVLSQFNRVKAKESLRSLQAGSGLGYRRTKRPGELRMGPGLVSNCFLPFSNAWPLASCTSNALRPLSSLQSAFWRAPNGPRS